MLTQNQKVLRLRGKEEEEKDLKRFKYWGDSLEQQNDKLNHHLISSCEMSHDELHGQ